MFRSEFESFCLSSRIVSLFTATTIRLLASGLVPPPPPPPPPPFSPTPGSLFPVKVSLFVQVGDDLGSIAHLSAA